MSRAARLVGLTVAPLLLAATAATAGATPAEPPASAASREAADLAVTGFALGSLRPAVVRRDAHALTTVTVAGIGITPDGAAVGAPTADMMRVARTVRKQGLRTELLLSNYSNRLEDFDPKAAHRLLSSPDHIAAVASAAAEHVSDGGWDGVNVDLELVRRSDAEGLVDLVAALQDALPVESTVTIDISASTSVRGYRDRGYDLAGLAGVIDTIELMAYDQHGPTWSGPGPVGGLGWQRDAVDAILEKVPADQVDLGVAGYGYTWPKRGTGHSVSAGGARKMAARAGVAPVWHARVGEWSARLPGGTVVWWSDARSYRQRVKLARSQGLHGLAIWRLGSADAL